MSANSTVVVCLALPLCLRDQALFRKFRAAPLFVFSVMGILLSDAGRRPYVPMRPVSQVTKFVTKKHSPDYHYP